MFDPDYDPTQYESATALMGNFTRLSPWRLEFVILYFFLEIIAIYCVV